MDFAEERNAEWLRLSPGIRTDDGQIDSIESVLLVAMTARVAAELEADVHL
jgi:hypothetical protein